MSTPETSSLDQSVLTDESRVFMRQLFARFPDLQAYATMERDLGREQWSLVVKVPALSGDPDARLVVWVEDGGEPGLAFGGWHTHASVWAAEPRESSQSNDLLDLVAGIFSERFIGCQDVGGTAPGSATILDLAVEDAVLNEITSEYSPGRVRLLSWAGRCDGSIGLDNYAQVAASHPALQPTPQRRRG
ncbi:MAG: hypothetical protein JWM10_217 [Myxococcaceae bacterium]|nr:hypothetical protein [Myxococcaceae bacterium]